MNRTLAAPRTEPRRRKLAELTSGVGAGVLGGGLALLLAPYLTAYAVPLVLVGALVHGWGMLDYHRLDRATGAEPVWWAEALYWVCWIALLVLALYIARGLARS
jgi:hypothetical protein